MTSNVKSDERIEVGRKLSCKRSEKMGRLRLVMTVFFWIYLMNVSGDIGQSRTSGKKLLAFQNPRKTYMLLKYKISLE